MWIGTKLFLSGLLFLACTVSAYCQDRPLTGFELSQLNDLKSRPEDPEANFRLARFFMDVDRHNPEMAVSYFEKAANLGHVKAAHDLGVMYQSGPIADQAKSFHWFRVAAERGDVASQGVLGKMCESSAGAAERGCSLDWYRTAAEHGDISSMNDLIRMATTGAEASKDYAQAYKWAIKVCTLGRNEREVATARQQIVEFKAHLSAQQQREAQGMVPLGPLGASCR